jgi:putative resolvase
MSKQFETRQPAYQPAAIITKQIQVSTQTLRKWANNGVIRCLRAGENGKRFYHVEYLHKHLGMSACNQASQQTEKIIYARVSSAHQKEDLLRQIQDLQTAFPDHTLVSDIGSGLNFKRKGLRSLLDKVLDGVVKEIVVMHKDRLCRYGTELLEFIFQKAGTKFVVYGQDEKHQSDTQELADDLLAITTVFVARNNGKRSAENRRRRKRNVGANFESS